MFVFAIKRCKAPNCLSQSHLGGKQNFSTVKAGRNDPTPKHLRAYPDSQSWGTLTHIIHQAAHVGNSIFTTRQGEALPYSTQSRETITREGGRRRRAVREQSGSVLPPDDLQVKARTWRECCLCRYSGMHLHHCGNDHSAKTLAMPTTEKWCTCGWLSLFGTFHSICLDSIYLVFF